MCGHVLLVFLGGWLPWVTDVSHLCVPVIESHLSVLHVFIVRLAIQLDTVLIVRRTQHTVTSSSFFAALTQLRSYGFSISFQMISSFSIISLNFLGPVRDSRLMSFGIISLTTNTLCASSIVFGLVLVLSHFQ